MTIKVSIPGSSVVNGKTIPPVLPSDAELGVAYIAPDGRLYWRTEGVTYYVNGTPPAPPIVAPIIGGAPMGLLMGITYPADGGG